MIINNKCTGCGICKKECTMHSIDITDNKATLLGSCINCGHCFAVCPNEAIDLEMPYLPTTPLSKILYFRRSLRQYENKLIPKEVLDEIISNASAYPSAVNQKCASVTIVCDPILLKTVRLSVMNTLKDKFKLLNYGPIRFFAKLFLGDNFKKVIRYKKLFDNMSEECDGITFHAPCLVFVHGNKNKIFIDEDCHYLAYNIVLLANEAGLGSCFMGFIRGHINKKTKKLLNIPKDDKIYSVFTLGYPSVEFLRPVPQEKVKTIVY
ncbi:MAG: nitroreductase family protein [Abditibacteriota bacterium]|nr:nitroreductase family protein [Abditibacteriota bacterium]